MRLTVINSNSAGNAYVLENEQEALLIECGVNIKKIKEALRFNLTKVAGCIVTHEHQDHCKAVDDLISAGVDIYASAGTHNAMGTYTSHRAVNLHDGSQQKIGRFLVKSFLVKHDAAEPMGFIIYHPECGTILFLTDTYYSEYFFHGLNHVIIEANFCEQIIASKLEDGETRKFLRDRIYKSHMSLQTCKKTLASSDLSGVRNILLIHLSNGHSDEIRFKREVEEQTGTVVTIARPGVRMELSNEPF
ncbi:MBL fold metallo-hydrolase [Nostoc ellipsosporum NOK]|nr:MBL fold metallo-hydrolase [Nostoc ellipsosporum NOK]